VILRDEFRAFTFAQKLVLFFSFRVNRLIDWLESHTLLHRRDLSCVIDLSPDQIINLILLSRLILLRL